MALLLARTSYDRFLRLKLCWKTRDTVTGAPAAVTSEDAAALLVSLVGIGTANDRMTPVLAPPPALAAAPAAAAAPVYGSAPLYPGG